MDANSPLSEARQEERKSQIAETDVLRLGERLINGFQLLIKLFQIYGSKNVPLHNFVRECVQTINILVEREKGFDLKIVGYDFFLNGQRLRYSTGGFASYKNLLTHWKKRLVGKVIFKAPVDEGMLRELIYGLLSLEEGREDNVCLLTDKLVENGISSIEVEPLESFEGEGRGKREGSGGDAVLRGTDPKTAAKKIFFEAITAVNEFMTNVTKEKSYPNVRKLKRVAQKAVSLILEDESFLLGLASIKNYDQYTFNHSVNVAMYSLAIGSRLGFSRKTLGELGVAALLHDIGKSKIPKEILNKPKSLTDEEFRIMKSHPLQGVEVVLNLKHMGEIDPKIVFGIFEHHQRDNLTGYPELLLKKERTFFGQIIQVADVYDALATPRVYKKAYTPEQSLSVMLKDKGSHFDPILLKILIGLVGIYPIGSLVLLNTRELGVVYKSNPQSADRPHLILLARDETGYPKKELIDLTETDGQGQYRRSITKTIDPLKHHIEMGKYFI